MKNMIYRILPVLAVAFLFSCEETEFPTITEKYVAFNRTSASLGESATTVGPDGAAVVGNNSIKIEVYRSTTDFSQPLTVGLSLSAEFTSDTDFAAAGDDATDRITLSKDISSLVIPGGAASTSFILFSQENLESSGDISVSIELTSVSDNTFKIGQQESQIGKSFSLTVVDDDCPIDLAGVWAGEYNVVSICGAPGAFNDGFCENTSKWSGQGPVTLAPDPSDPLGLTAILSGGFHLDDLVLEFQTCPQTVSISDTYNLNISQGGQVVILPTDEPDVYGTGTFDPESLKFNIVVSYSNVSGSNFQEFIISYEKIK